MGLVVLVKDPEVVRDATDTPPPLRHLYPYGQRSGEPGAIARCGYRRKDRATAPPNTYPPSCVVCIELSKAAGCFPPKFR